MGLLSLFFTSFVPRVTNDFKVILKETPTFWQKVRAQWIPHIDAWMQNHFGDSLSPVLPTTKPSPPPAPPKLRINRLPDGELELDTRDLQLEIVHQTEGTWVLRSPTPIGEGNNEPEHRFADALDRYIGELRQSSTQRLNQVVRLGQLFVAGVLEAITMFILVLMISIFLLLDSERILRGIRALFPQRYTKDFDNMVEVVDKGLSGAVRGQLLICCINGILTWIGLYIFNVKYSFLLALLAAMMSLIPIFGSILSSVPIVIVALVSGQGGIDLLRGLMILGWIIGVHLLEANLLNPKIIGTATRIQPVVVIFAVVAGEQSYGPVGALLAVPLVSAVQGIFLYLRQKIRAESMSEK
jgi:predicted PurR-regulated permease PerM